MDVIKLVAIVVLIAILVWGFNVAFSAVGEGADAGRAAFRSLEDHVPWHGTERLVNPVWVVMNVAMPLFGGGLTWPVLAGVFMAVPAMVVTVYTVKMIIAVFSA